MCFSATRNACFQIKGLTRHDQSGPAFATQMEGFVGCVGSGQTMGIAQNNGLGGMHHLGRKQARSRDDLITDYIRSVLRPGDRSLQLGRSPQGLTEKFNY